MRTTARSRADAAVRSPPPIISSKARLQEAYIPQPPEGCSRTAMSLALKPSPPRRDIRSTRGPVLSLPMLLA